MKKVFWGIFNEEDEMVGWNENHLIAECEAEEYGFEVRECRKDVYYRHGRAA
jgi:hypothetical protein